MKIRRKPSHGVYEVSNGPTIVFLTVCTRGRIPWLATTENHLRLRDVWQSSSAWSVGRYVIMPDHLHVFASPTNDEVTLETWVKFWKSRFSKSHPEKAKRWQTDHWDKRLRSSESYEEKWLYVQQNPVRAGLVETPDEWPFQGELNRLDW